MASFLKRWFGNAWAAKDRLAKSTPTATAEGYRIDFDMMVKGSVYKRRSGLIRQYGVTVGGATRLVTSGDVVDRPTYDALLAAGAIRAPKSTPPESEAPRRNKEKQKAV